MYASKPTSYLSTVIEEVVWEINKKKLFNTITFLLYMTMTKCLRLNCQNMYNFEMDHTNIAGQLAHYYQTGIGLRNTKWCWSILFWALGQVSVNPYLLYNTYMLSHGFKPISYYDFDFQLVLGWLEWKMYWPTRHSKPRNTSRQTSRAKRRARFSIPWRTLRLDGEELLAASTLTDTVPSKPTCARTNFGSATGNFRNRLTIDSSNNHLAEPITRKEGRCKLHKWVLQGINYVRSHGRVKGQLVHCVLWDVQCDIVC